MGFSFEHDKKMNLNRRQVKKDEDVLSKIPRSKEKFRGEGERG